MHLTIPHTLRTLQSPPIHLGAPCNLNESLRSLFALICDDYIVKAPRACHGHLAVRFLPDLIQGSLYVCPTSLNVLFLGLARCVHIEVLLVSCFFGGDVPDALPVEAVGN